MYYLIPVKMLLGELPSEQALRMHNLDVYSGIVEVRLQLQSKLEDFSSLATGNGLMYWIGNHVK